MSYALDVLPRGGEKLVSSLLWTSNATLFHGGAIKYDLDWIASGWGQETCDLWEEVQATSFFWNLYTARRALHMGISFAFRMNDSDSAYRYTNAVKALNSTLASHIGDGGLVIESSNRPQDAAVVCAFNNGDADDGVFPLAGPNVAATIAVLAQAFRKEFPINHQDDSTLGVPGILFGRYPGDTYNGWNGGVKKFYFSHQCGTLIPHWQVATPGC